MNNQPPSFHRARKRFGQNFLIDAHIITALIQSIGVKEHDHIIEIGPGLGALTKPLLHEIGNMTAIELDRDLIANLSLLPGLTVIHQDILDVDIGSLRIQNKDIRFVGNLPYNISTPIIFHLLQYCGVIKDMHFMLQKEVIDRLSASPNTKAYGRLSVMVQRYCKVEPLILIPPEAFRPAPKVMSQFVRLIPHKVSPVVIHDEIIFSNLVKAAFAMKRKTVKNNLSGLLSVDEILLCDIDPSARAEGLSLEAFARLANVLADQVAKGM